MTNAYKELKQLVDDGDLSIVYIDSPPRTVSSALLRSMAQIAPACAYEPFHYPSDGYSKGLEVLLETAKKLGVNDRSVSKPVRLVTKEISRYLPDEAWESWMPLVTNFIVTIRDPSLQLHSLVKRAANDFFYERYGASGLSDEQVWELAGQIGVIFRDGGKIVGRKVPGDFERTGWSALHEHLEKLEAHLLKHPKKQLTIVDGFLLRAAPRALMAELLQRLEIEYNTQTLARVVSHWTKDSGSHIKRADAPVYDAYRTKVVASAGYQPPLDPTPRLAEFPESLQLHLKETAFPIFLKFLSLPGRIGPTNPQGLMSLFNKEVDGIRLVERNPHTAHSLLASLDEESLQPHERTEQKEQMENLRLQFPEHSDVFELIDQILEERRASRAMQSLPA